MDFIEIIKAAVLAVVQGLTEFLPVSSSGHLAIVNKMLNTGFDMEQFAITLHFGTMLATVWVFWDEIIDLIKSLGTIPSAIKNKEMNKDLKVVVYIIVASIPTAVAGLFLEDYFEGFMGNLILVGVMLFVTGSILMATRFIKPGDKDAKTFGVGRSFLLGVAQSLAIMPGLSRSGTTIAASLFMKGEREFAGKISFLISLPAIFGATLFKFIDYRQAGVCPFGTAKVASIVGFIVSFVVGLLALKWLLNLVKKGKFYYFAFYCFALGAAAIILSLTGVLG